MDGGCVMVANELREPAWVRRGFAGLVVHRWALLAFALLLIGANSIYALGAMRTLDRAQERVDHTQHVLLSLGDLQARLARTEGALRSYLLTGSRALLEHYQTGAAGVPDAVAAVRILTQDNAAQQRRLSVVEPLVAKRLALLRAGMERRQRGDGVDAAALEAGDRLMHQIRTGLADLHAEERRLYTERLQAARRQANLAQALLVLGMALSLAIIAAVFALARREERMRVDAEGRLRAANSELERRVEERTMVLADKERFLATVIDNMHDAIIVHRDNAVVLANQRFVQLVGAESSEQVIGQSPLAFYPAELRDSVARRVRYVMSGGASVPLVEQRLVRRDGKAIDVEATSIAFADRGRRTALSIYRDITDRKAAELQLRQAQKMEAVGQLTGGMAHDFNNLLTVIVANLDILGESLHADKKSLELVEAALGGALRGAKLTHRLLAFARKQPLEPQVIDLNERLPTLVEMLRRTLGEQIRVELKLADGLWPTCADPSQVEDALLNLAINARDAMPQGGTLTIETGNGSLDADYAARNPEIAPGDYVLLSVTDTGTGMPPEVIAHAVEPFFTTKEQGKGTGLGLSMIYGFAKQSGGHLKIYSEVDHGTTVRLYLPRAVEAGATAPDPMLSVPALPGGRETILLVEDNDEVRAAAIRQLTDLGYRVRAAANGPAGLALLDADDAVDLLFTDIVMPERMTGYELAQAVRARRPQIKVLFATGFAEAPAAAQQPQPGALVLRKPYRKQELAEKVRMALDVQ